MEEEQAKEAAWRQAVLKVRDTAGRHQGSPGKSFHSKVVDLRM